MRDKIKNSNLIHWQKEKLKGLTLNRQPIKEVIITSHQITMIVDPISISPIEFEFNRALKLPFKDFQHRPLKQHDEFLILPFFNNDDFRCALGVLLVSALLDFDIPENKYSLFHHFPCWWRWDKLLLGISRKSMKTCLLESKCKGAQTKKECIKHWVKKIKYRQQWRFSSSLNEKKNVFSSSFLIEFLQVSGKRDENFFHDE